MARVSFTGGPLDGQMREMDVYVSIIPVHVYENEAYVFNEHGFPEAYYQNVNAMSVDSQLRNSAFIHYVFHIRGKRV